MLYQDVDCRMQMQFLAALSTHVHLTQQAEPHFLSAENLSGEKILFSEDISCNLGFAI